MKSPRIALLAARLDTGGVADHVSTLGAALRERGAVVWELERGAAVPEEAEWVVLHFVCYGWARRGILCGRDIEGLARVCEGRRVAVFFHELWIGEAAGEPLKNRLVGAWQRRGILRLVKRLGPERVLSSNPVYRAMLADGGVEAEVLALPGNMPVATEADRAEARGWLAARCAGGEGVARAAVFGALHAEWDGAEALRGWAEFEAARGRAAVLLALGRGGPAGAERLAALEAAVPQVRIVRAGEMSAGLLAGLLAECDLGLATSPWALIGKSGSVAAFLEAGLPVVVTRNEWRRRRGETPEPEAHALLFKWTGAEAAEWGRWLGARRGAEPRLGATADAWLRSLGGA